jgi:phosphoserine phosphatase RsbU/P
MVIRQGLQHALAQRGVRILQAVFVSGLIYLGVVISRTADLAWLRIPLYLMVALVIVFLKKLADRLRLWTDRRFFRDAYNREQLLADLSTNIRTMVEVQPLLETVAQRIAAALHIERIALMVHSNDAYRPAYALGYADAPPIDFPAASPVVERMNRMRAPMMIYFDDPQSWLNRLTGPNAADRERLESMGSQVLLPMNVQDRLLGFVSLGPKQSEEPYSGGDLRLLETVAGQTALVLENSRLAAAVEQGIAQRERLNRELEIARDVQQRLFPQKLPAVPGLDYAGQCRPAESVGGDYYDFLLAPDGKFVLAIGDVSGKGVPAALMMASLQASLRGLVISGPAEPAAVIGNMNRLIYDASARNVFATFFFAEFDPASHVLTYVNAGHNAPFLFRKTGETERLPPGGIALGLTGKSSYRQTSLTLAEGDLLVAFTDGVTEAMNSQMEEFGDERLEQAIREGIEAGAHGLMQAIVAAADAFAGVEPQHDDLTLVVARTVCKPNVH